MITEQTRALFPRKILVTEDMIAKSDVWDCTDCIGFHSLTESLKDTDLTALSWGCMFGRMLNENGEAVRLTTEEGIDVAGINIPTEITFIITPLQP